MKDFTMTEYEKLAEMKIRNPHENERYSLQTFYRSDEQNDV